LKGGNAVDFGLLTTPVLHFMVKHDNDANIISKDSSPYFEQISKSFKELTKGEVEKRNIDCAFGVGANVLSELQKYLPNHFELLNDDVSKTENLNKICGAEYVQKEKKKPLNFKNCVASFDGDGDRIVYSFEENDNFILIDGDKISSLIALFFSKYLPKDSTLLIGVVQTAYANGSSTKFLKSMIDLVPIGNSIPKLIPNISSNWSQAFASQIQRV
jgi:phosphoacetylglucosamine mutase